MKHNWEYKRLGTICQMRSGSFISAEELDDAFKYPCFGGNGVRGYIQRFSHDGDFIIIGRVGALCGNVNQFDGRFYATEHAIVVSQLISYVSRWLYYQLSSMNLRKYAKGAAQPVISVGTLNNIEIHVPPMEVQDQIVAELDKINDVIEDCRELLRNLDTLAQSLFYDFFGDPITNPKGWEMRPLKDVSIIKIGPFGSLLHKEDYISGGTPLVNPIHMKNGYVKADIDFTIDERKKESLSNYILRTNDIVFGRRGDIGRCALITDKEDGFLCGTGSLLVRFSIQINSLFALWCLKQNAITKYLIEKAKGATMLNINCGIIGSIPLILPPLSLQEKFASRIEQIEAQKKSVEQTIATLKTLLDSRMDYWFN